MKPLKRPLIMIIATVLMLWGLIIPSSVAFASPSGEDMPNGDINGWKLIFNDDFLVNVPLGSFSGCTSASRTCTGLPAGVKDKWWAYDEGWHDTSGNGVYTPAQVASISGGIMNVNLHTSGGVHMVGAMVPKLPGVSGSQGGQLYGRYAVRFKSDSIHNYKTAWLAWPDSGVWPRDGELDFPEGDLDSTIGGFVHAQNGSSGSDQVGFPTSQSYTSWHTAVIEWSPGSVKYLLDGKIIGSSTSRIPDTPMHWVLQSETNLSGSVPSASDGGNIQIDWAAAWAYSPGTVASTPISVGNQPSLPPSNSGKFTLTPVNPLVMCLPEDGKPLLIRFDENAATDAQYVLLKNC